MPNQITIRFSKGSFNSFSDTIDCSLDTPFLRHTGFVPTRYALKLLDDVGLTANPRSSKKNTVVADILNTLQNTPELFHHKSKGLLIGASTCKPLQRDRFTLRFDDPSIEGVLDGGHNLLAIGLFLLQQVMEERDWRRLKSWDQMIEAWRKYGADIDQEDSSLDILIPVELLVPNDEDHDKESFLMQLIEVCEARNNNVQLPLEAKSNKQGFYDEIKKALPAKLSTRVEWKPNEWEDNEEQRPIKVRDLVALSWLPLNILNEHDKLPNGISVRPQSIYMNKGECSKRFEELMSLREVTIEDEGARRKLIHSGVRSAIQILADLPNIYDQIYEYFPHAYNEGNKRFGANPIVKIYDPEKQLEASKNGKSKNPYLKKKPETPFNRKAVKYSYPEGLILPLIYGLTKLMTVEEGQVRWKVDNAAKFISDNLRLIAGQYGMVLDMCDWDPRKIAKDGNPYLYAASLYDMALSR